MPPFRCAAGVCNLPDGLRGQTELTLRAAVRLDPPSPQRLLTIRNDAGEETLTLLVRRAGDDPALAESDRRQNYARCSGADRLVLECVAATEPPRAMIELRRAQHEARRAQEPGLAPFQLNPAIARGRLRVGVPLAMLGDARELDVVVRLGGPHIELLAGGAVVDEEWPAGPWQGGGSIDVSDAVRQAELIPGVHGAAPAPPLPPMGQYWAPRDHNAWAGDAMLTADGERLHLFWLTDRRLHGSKYACGGCSFAHASTTDLRDWTHHPLAYPLTEYWEAANGTGCVVAHEGVHYVYANVLSERLGIEREHPNGPHLAISRDGIHYTKQGRAAGLPGEPGIVRDERGVFHAVSASRHDDGVWRSSRYESADLRRWRLADADFLPPPGWPATRTVFSSECFNWFHWGAWWYIIGGRTGFWRAKKLLGPYLSVHDAGGPAWDIYEGLFVPQATVWKGRGILAGWLTQNDNDWGGHLVFRELVQRPDGDLDMRRLPEMERPVSALALPPVVVDGRDGLRFIGQRIPGGDVRLRWRLDPAGCARFGLRLGGAGEGEGVELRFDPAARTAQWGTPRPGALAADAVGMGYHAGDFAILGVEGLDRPFELDVVVHRDAKSGSVIVDAMLDRRRTLVTRRQRIADGLITWFAESGRLTVSS